MTTLDIEALAEALCIRRAGKAGRYHPITKRPCQAHRIQAMLVEAEYARLTVKP